MKNLRIIFIALGLTGLFFTTYGIAEESPESTHSGFLGDDSSYAQLEEVKIGKKKGMRWSAPELNGINYHSLLIADVALYPAPTPGEQVTEETLLQITTYASSQLREILSQTIAISDASGPGVLRMETAITAVNIKTEGMKAYEILPVAAIFGAAKAATGNRNMDVRVQVETRFIDSTSGQVVGLAMRELEGEDLKGQKDKLTLEDVQQDIDQAIVDAAGTIGDFLSTK